MLPNSALAQSEPFALIVMGANFVKGADVYWDLVRLPTTFVSSTQLQAQLSALDLETSGSFLVKVVNPGGTSSEQLPFTLQPAPPSYYPTTVIPQAANDLAWDSSNGLIYLSVPSTASQYGNSIIAFDPDAGVIVASQFAGSEPSRLAISDDNQFIYVGLTGAASVARFTLPSLQPSLQYSLGDYAMEPQGKFFVLDLQIAPGLPHTSAVSVAILGASPGQIGGITIFDDGTPRSENAENDFSPVGLYDSFQWGIDATRIYPDDYENTGFDFYVLSISAAGATGRADYPGIEPYPRYAEPYGNRIHFDPGTRLVYGDNGFVVDSIQRRGRGLGKRCDSRW